MARTVTATWSDACLRHEPRGEVWVGVTIPGTELPERATRIRAALDAAGIAVVTATPTDLGRHRLGPAVLGQVHDPGLLEHLRDVMGQWEAAGYPQDPGQDRVVPYVFPTDGLLHGLPERDPAAVHARAGRYCYDTMTLVGPGTWEAAVGAVDATLAAVDVAQGSDAIGYAVCRPPGHHAARGAFGGSCYLNNAAVAAQALVNGGAARVAVVDIDAHHGNGTQALFYDRGDVLYGSVHVDPGAGWFPHFVGFADERGRGDGAGTNVNLPLAPGSGDAPWLDAVEQLVTAASDFGAEGLVVSLGVDAAADDPESPLRVTSDGYREAGRLLGDLAVPTVAVQEGGYHLATLGHLVVAALSGLAGSEA